VGGALLASWSPWCWMGFGAALLLLIVLNAASPWRVGLGGAGDPGDRWGGGSTTAGLFLPL
jgi:hypothetical protein